MGSKHTPSKWWKDYAAEVDTFEGIVSRERTSGGLLIKFKDGGTRFESANFIAVLGPPTKLADGTEVQGSSMFVNTRALARLEFPAFRSPEGKPCGDG